jgi:hypothetical protein
MTAPEPRASELGSDADQSTLTLVRDDLPDVAPLADPAPDGYSPATAPARRKIWPA